MLIVIPKQLCSVLGITSDMSVGIEYEKEKIIITPLCSIEEGEKEVIDGNRFT